MKIVDWVLGKIVARLLGFTMSYTYDKSGEIIHVNVKAYSKRGEANFKRVLEKVFVEKK